MLSTAAVRADEKHDLAVGVAPGNRATDKSLPAVPCWGLKAKEDPRYFRAHYLLRNLDETLGYIDNLIDEKMEAAEADFAGALPDALSRSFYRHGMPPVLKGEIEVDLSSVNVGIPREKGEIDWNKIWLNRDQFENVYRLEVADKTEMPIALAAQPFNRLKVHGELSKLSLAQLEILKEKLLRHQDQQSNERTAAQAKQGNLDFDRLAHKRYAFAYEAAKEEELEKQRLEELKLICPGGKTNFEALKDLRAVSDVVAEYTHRRETKTHEEATADRKTELHGLPPALRVAFLKLPPERRAELAERTRAEKAAAEEGRYELRPELTLLAHELLNGFGDKNFTSELMQGLRELVALRRYEQSAKPPVPDDYQARVLEAQEKIILHLEGALKLAKPTDSPAEIREAKATLSDIYLAAGKRSELPGRDELLAKGFTLSSELTRAGKNTEAGAHAAAVALRAYNSLSPAGQATHAAQFDALAANIADEEANPTWRREPASQLANHLLGVRAMNRAHAEALKPIPHDLAAKRARAIKHLSKVDDPAHPAYYQARLLLAQSYLDSSHGTNVTDALKVLDALTLPNEASQEELRAYLRAKLLQARLHILMQEPKKAEALAKQLDGLKARVEEGDPIRDSIARLQPSADLQKARGAFKAGKFEEAIKMAERAALRLQAQVEKAKPRDYSLELDLQDMRQVIFLAKVRSGMEVTPAMSSYRQWLVSQSPLGEQARHDRLLANIALELGELRAKKGEAARLEADKARAQYRNFFTRGFLGGTPTLGPEGAVWQKPLGMKESAEPSVVEKHRLAGEALSLLGDESESAGNAVEAQADRAAAAIVFSSVKPPHMTELYSANEAIRKAELALEANPGIPARQQALYDAHQLRDNVLRSFKERQDLLARALKEYRLASGGNPDSPAYKEAVKLFEAYLRLVPRDGGRSGMEIKPGDFQQHFVQIANEEQKWRWDVRAGQKEFDAEMAKRYNGFFFATYEARTAMPLDPLKCRDELIDDRMAKFPGRARSDVAKMVDDEINAYWFGRLHKQTRQELAAFWQTAADYQARNAASDPIALYQHYRAAATAADQGMMGWRQDKQNQPYRASSLAFLGYEWARPGEDFYRLYDGWMTNTINWGESVSQLRKARPGDVKVDPKALGADVRRAWMGIRQIEKSDPEHWKTNKERYLKLLERAKAILSDPATGGPAQLQ